MNSLKTATVRNLTIGGSAPVRVQTMYDSTLINADVDAIVERIALLNQMGCDLIRFSFVSEADEPAFREICSRSVIPVVADIHFDYKMALMALDSGADKIRINPGNIGAKWKCEEVVRAAKARGAAIRIGLNTGSLPKGHENEDPVELMVNTALQYIEDFESWGFDNTVVSLKSSDIDNSMRAARLFKAKSEYPLHLGITEAGSAVTSAVRSAWALGTLLKERIGDTLRVSINGSIEDEIIAGVEILRTLGLREEGVRIVACPRCGRHTFDSQGFLSQVQNKLLALNKNISVAIMGCSVNGPGEAKNADYAVTGIGRKIFLYKKGVLFKEVDKSDAEKALFEAIENE